MEFALAGVSFSVRKVSDGKQLAISLKASDSPDANVECGVGNVE